MKSTLRRPCRNPAAEDAGFRSSQLALVLHRRRRHGPGVLLGEQALAGVETSLLAGIVRQVLDPRGDLVAQLPRTVAPVVGAQLVQELRPLLLRLEQLELLDEHCICCTDRTGWVKDCDPDV